MCKLNNIASAALKEVLSVKEMVGAQDTLKNVNTTPNPFRKHLISLKSEVPKLIPNMIDDIVSSLNAKGFDCSNYKNVVNNLYNPNISITAENLDDIFTLNRLSKLSDREADKVFRIDAALVKRLANEYDLPGYTLNVDSVKQISRSVLLPNVKCICCGKEDVYLTELYNNYVGTVECKSCGHIAGRPSYNYKPISQNECKCVERFNRYVEAMECAKKAALLNVDKSYESLSLSFSEINLPYAYKEDYLLNRNNLTKDERFILSLKPTNQDDLIRLIDKAIDSQSISTNKKELLAKLEKHNVIYSHPTLVTLDKYREIMKTGINNLFSILNPNLNYSIYKEDSNLTRDITNQLYALENIPKFIKDDNHDGFYTNKWKLVSHGRYNVETKYEECVFNSFFTYSYKINPNFFNISSSFNITSHNVLKSNAEQNTFAELQKQYSGAIVMPNYSLSQLLTWKDRSRLKKELDEEDYSYILRCIIDFVIVDTGGFVIKCIECQKGKHHNECEWVEKDSLKKYALETIGIPFEEVF